MARISKETILHSTLMELVKADAVKSAYVIGTREGWSILVKYGMIERVLVSKHSQKVRFFKQWESLVNYLKKLGITKFWVDSKDFEQSKPGKKRPQASVALKRIHQAAKEKLEHVGD